MNILTKQIKFSISERVKIILMYAFLILLAFSIRYFMFSISDNYWGADPDERIRITANWLSLKWPKPIFPSNLWLPLPFYLMAIVIRLFNNITAAPRLLHVIIGAITIIPFYNLVKLIFNKDIALFSTLIFIFYPLHIICSIVTLSEGPFLFLILISLCYFFRYYEEDKFNLFIISFIFLILSALVRYEAMIFAACLIGILISKKRYKNGLILLFIFVLFPLIWAILTKRAFGYIFSYLQMPYLIFTNKLKIEGTSNNYFYWILVMAKYLTWPLLIFSIFGSSFSLKDKKKFSFYVICLTLLLFFTYAVSFYCLNKNDEFSLCFSVLLIPFAVFGLYESFYKFKKYRNLIILVLIAPLLLFMLNKNLNLVNRYPDYLNKVALFLKYNSGTSTKILLNNYNYQSNHIAIIAGKNTKRFKISGYGGDFLIKKEEIMEYIVKEKPKYIVYSDEGELKALFNEKYLLSHDSGISLNLVLESGPYIIYSVNYTEL